MKKFGKLIFLIMGLGASSMAFADWIPMHLISDWQSRSWGNSAWTTCRYSTGGFSGEEIAIRVSGNSCPSMIQYNPETNQWRPY